MQVMIAWQHSARRAHSAGSALLMAYHSERDPSGLRRPVRAKWRAPGTAHTRSRHVAAVRGARHESPFALTQRLCRVLCGSALSPDHLAYGSNDWCKLHDIGVRPGIWLRPLETKESLPATWFRAPSTTRLDPSVPEVLDLLQGAVHRTVNEWGYDLIKHDYSTNCHRASEKPASR
jgi:hypothetical protein